MGTRALNNRVKKLRSWKDKKAELEKAIEELKAEIKAEMESKDVKELNTGLYVIRFKEVITNRFDSKTFKMDYTELYNEYLKAAVSKRFSIA